ncbi:MAG: FAD-binding oxidoreductase [Actinomycetota bacterium]|nr:FAD-binding oxidoreductase [Rubrobacteraceae bacterium]MDQ3438682.1 FAD-binding oxidoreductase [Actinomycetota bacterium]
METVIQGSTLQTLRAGLRGTAHAPGEEGYEDASRAWNLAAHQQPALVVVAGGAADVMAAVRFAREGGLGVGVMATGHGVGAACDGGVLINTSNMRGVRVDPVDRTARVEAGALWLDLIHESQVHGLAGLLGSTSHVGIVGYTMGGGFGWLGRKYGFNAASVREADVVTADGELVRVSAGEHPDLFWGLGGGGGNFGIVTSLKFDLYPIGMLYGGNLIYPVEKASEVLDAYVGWSADLPDEMTSGVAFLNVPPLPALPEPLRGKSVIAVRGCYCGESPQTGEELLRPLREELGEPIMDTFGMMPYAAMDSISMDPVDPMGARQHSEMLSELSPEAIETLVEVAGAGSGSPLILLELRQLGGALARNAEHLSTMGKGDSKFIMNGIGPAFTPEMAEGVMAYLARVADATRPFQTGDTYVNFMELEGASAERVKAAYAPEDFERLVALKDRYDPQNVFRFNRNIAPSKA